MESKIIDYIIIGIYCLGLLYITIDASTNLVREEIPYYECHNESIIEFITISDFPSKIYCLNQDLKYRVYDYKLCIDESLNHYKCYNDKCISEIETTKEVCELIVPNVRWINDDAILGEKE